MFSATPSVTFTDILFSLAFLIVSIIYSLLFSNPYTSPPSIAVSIKKFPLPEPKSKTFFSKRFGT